jgi:hypothetical protein
MKTRRVGEIFRFAVAVVEAGEDAQHLEMALQAHPFQVAVEVAEVRIDRQAGARGPSPSSGPTSR